MAPVPRKKATYEDLMAVPDHLVAEILDGELVTHPRPASAHALAGSAITADLFGRFSGPGNGPDSPGGWWILFEPELHLGEDVVVPDVAGWRRERMPRIPDVAAFTLRPDWVCEIVSPSTARADRVLKMPIYAREGVLHLWIVDPVLQTLETFRRDASGWVVSTNHAGKETVRAAPFDAVEIDIARWWIGSE
jgi:Uma2 family endonuclease